MKAHHLFVLLISILCVRPVYSQSSRVQESFTITKDKKLTLPKVERQKYLSPINEVPRKEISKVSFESLSIRPKLSLTVTPLEIQVMPPVFEKADPYHHQISIGFGNRLNSAFHYGFIKKYSNTSSIMAQLNHLGWVRGQILDEKSAENGQNIRIGWSDEKENQRLGVSMNVGRLQYAYFGIPDSMRMDKTITDQILPQTRWHLKSSVDYFNTWEFLNVQGKMVYEMTDLGAIGSLENKFEIEAGVNWNLSDDLTLKFAMDLDQLNINGFQTSNRTILQPTVNTRFNVNSWKIEAGIVAGIGDEYTFSSDRVRVYPNLQAIKNFGKSKQLHIQYTGGMQPHSLASLTQQNVYLNENLDIRTQNNRAIIAVNYAQSLKNSIHIKTFIQYQSEENRPFFANNIDSLSQFNLIYDDGITGLFQVGGGLSGTLNEQVTYDFSLQINQYLMDSLDNAYHMPSFQSSISATYQPLNKWMISSGLTYYYGIVYGTSNQLINTPESENIVNWSINSSYKVKENIKSFISVDNLLNQSNSYYYLYPTVPRLVTFGVQLHF